MFTKVPHEVGKTNNRPEISMLFVNFVAVQYVDHVVV